MDVLPGLDEGDALTGAENLLPYASSRLTDGLSPVALRAELVARGASQAAADEAVGEACRVVRRRALRSGTVYLAIGLASFAAGAAVTGASYAAAARTGDSWWMAIGLLGFGVGFTIGGAVRLLTAPRA